MSLEARLRQLNRRYPNGVNRVRSLLGPIIRFAERLLFGGPMRERLLVALLGAHYASARRRAWLWSDDQPHFYDQRLGLFELGFSGQARGAYPLLRGMFVAEIIRPGDRLLDIGCGDGFFAARFFSPRCSRVDALDIEPDAIATARRFHTTPKVNYHLTDAVRSPFPKDQYDVVVWDGALGHFPPHTNAPMLEKIRAHLAPGGIFAGSESLGLEGKDHLQFFHSLDELRQILEPYFPCVALRAVTYPIGGLTRTEAFWRCSDTSDRMREASWGEGNERTV